MSRICSRVSFVLVLAVSAVVAGCATRAPVVVTDAYPGYPVPEVPAELVDDPAAGAHHEAWRLLQSGDLDAAERQFGVALSTSDDFYPSYAGLGFVELSRRAPEQAVAMFASALTRGPAYIPALLGRGEALLELGRMGEAIASFDAAVAADPTLTALRRRVEDLRFNDLMAQVTRARSARDAGRSDEARASYERLIEASPDSGFLYLELAEVEQREGRADAALGRLDQAITRDPGAVAAWRMMADLYLAAGDLDRGEQALLRAESIEPSPVTSRLLADIETRRREVASRPPEYAEIATADAVTRGQLAALIGILFERVVADAAGQGAAIVADARDYWGYAWILAVAQAGVMDADTNYRFRPEREVTRADLADVLVRVRRLSVGHVDPLPAAPRFSDLAPSHLRYPAASEAVALGLLAALEQNTFQPARVVTGAEAMDAVERLSLVLAGAP
ncbi:MAG: tetratricopeptide repeat protein [Acidobacteria bacterium]|nr:tetratricopeptide repeat protein [Acidobacteriota bacterium]